MNNVSTQSIVMKPLIIGRVWDNGDVTSASGVPQPRLKVKINRDLGLNITIVPGTEFALWPNTKRTDRKDPDYSMSVQLPTETVDAEIARQQKAKKA